MPIVLTNRRTGKKFRVKLYALVLENLLMGMFIAGGTGPFRSMGYSREGVIHGLELGADGEPVEVTGR